MITFTLYSIVSNFHSKDDDVDDDDRHDHVHVLKMAMINTVNIHLGSKRMPRLAACCFRAERHWARISVDSDDNIKYAKGLPCPR